MQKGIECKRFLYYIFTLTFIKSLLQLICVRYSNKTGCLIKDILCDRLGLNHSKMDILKFSIQKNTVLGVH